MPAGSELHAWLEVLAMVGLAVIWAARTVLKVDDVKPLRMDLSVLSDRVRKLEDWRIEIGARTTTIEGDVKTLNERHHNKTVPWQETTNKRMYDAETTLRVHEDRIERAEHDIEGLQDRRR